MRRLFIITYFLFFLSVCTNGQTTPSDLSPEEERAAKDLAVSFFNRFQETQDITPLIKEFFIKDFARRLKFCNTTGECGGRFRDFWGKQEELTALKATSRDFQRWYLLLMNNLFLYFRSIQYLNDNYPQKMTDSSYKIATKTIDNELICLLGVNHKLLKYNFFSESGADVEDDFKPKTLNEFRQLLNNYETFLAALKTVESKLRTAFRKKKPDVEISFSPTEFPVHVEENYNRFFDYPIGTKMLEIWCDNDSLLFVMNLIKENGKLKVVAIYLPID